MSDLTAFAVGACVGGRAVVVDSKGHLGYAVTKVVPNVESAAGVSLSNPASIEDVVRLRTEIASLRAELSRVKAEVASLRKPG